MIGRTPAAIPDGLDGGSGRHLLGGLGGSGWSEGSEASAVLGGRYELGGLIAEGGMARVFRGTDRRLGRPVAIKLLRPQHAASAEWRARFHEEARAAASLAHPHLVQVFDAGEDGLDGGHGEEALRPYIVMELLPGRTLKDLVVGAGGPLPPRDAAALARQIALGMAAAHRRGLVHRDLKPQNVLITEDGSAKVGDFGLARASGGAQLTQPGTVWGTVQYLSPEQAEGRPADARSDIYALGGILFELLTGSPPYQADTPAAILLKHIAGPVPRARDKHPSLPEAVDAVLGRALAKSPDERFQSMDELAEALASLASQADAITHPTAWPVPAPAVAGAVTGAGTGHPGSRSRPDDVTVTLRELQEADHVKTPAPAVPAGGPRQPKPHRARAPLVRAAGLALFAAVAIVGTGGAVQALRAGLWAPRAPIGAVVSSPSTQSPQAQASPVAGAAAVASPSASPLAPSAAVTPVPRPLGAYVRLAGWSVTVARYEWHTSCPRGVGRLAPGAKFAAVRIAGRNDLPTAAPVPALEWTLAGHPASADGTGEPLPCQPEGRAPAAACAPGVPLAARARCDGLLVFEVPASVEVRGALLLARAAGAAAPEVAAWRLT